METILDSQEDLARKIKKPKSKTKEESVRELQKQFKAAEESGNKNLTKFIESILNKLGEPIRDTQLSKALKKRK